MLRYAEPAIPLVGYLAEHSANIYGEVGWSRGGGLPFAKNIAARYTQLGREIQYRKKWSKSWLTMTTLAALNWKMARFRQGMARVL